MTQVQTQWLKDRKKSLKVSDDEIARAVGIDRSVVNKIIGGKVAFAPRYADGFAEALQLGRDDILFRFGVLDKNPQSNILENSEPVITLPILGEVPAGNWREAVLDHRGWTHVPQREARDGMYALRVSGDSMNKIVEDGAIIIIDPDDQDVFHRRLFVVRDQEGEVTFKRYMDGPGRLEPCSKNPEHKVIPITDRGYQIIGRVTKIMLDPAQAAFD